MRLSRRQTLALKRSTRPINVWYGSVRSSKTHGSLWDFVRVMSERSVAQQRGEAAQGVVLVVGLSTNTAWRNIFQPILSHEDFKNVAPFLRYRQSAPSGSLFGMPFSVVGANNEASWQAIQGMTVAYCLGDEATGWPESFWDMLISRLSLSTSRLLVTCNPGTSNHYLKTKIIDRATTDPDIHVEKFLLKDNPTLPPNYVARLERMYTGLFYKRMIQAMWVAAEGAVYESWNPDTMVQHTPPPDTTLCVGIDYGTNHPTAGYAIGVHNNRLTVFSEWSPNLTTGTHQRLTDSQLADSYQQWAETLPTPPRYIYCDPAAASFREEMKQRGLPTAKAANSILDGIRTVDSLLTGGNMTINPTCPHLINELPSYRWDTKATDKGKDAPIKENDDHCDALRYAVYSSRHLWRRQIEPTT